MSHFLKAATISVLFACSGVLFAAGADWPNYRGPATDAVVADAKIADKLNFDELWKAKLGDSFGQIAVSGDTAAAFVKRGNDEFAIALNAKTGAELWSTRIDKSIQDSSGGDGPRTTPAINAGHIYIYSTHMKLVCLNVADGKVAWTHDIAAEFGAKEPKWGNAASPVVVDDLVIVLGSTPDKCILAFNKATGAAVWSKGKDALTHATPTVATISGTKQVICLMQSGLVSVDPKSGDILWTFANPYSTSTAASPVVGGKNGDIVYVSAAYDVGAAACRVAKDADKWTATELWRTKGKNMQHWSTSVYHDGYIYGLFGKASDKGPLACLDIETGALKWSENGFGNQGGLIALGDKLLVQTPKGDLVLVAASPDAFKELDRKPVFKGKNWTAPSYVDGLIFARNNSDDRGGGSTGVCLKLK